MTTLPNSGRPASIYRAFSSASMKRAFSASVPMVTRNHSGQAVTADRADDDALLEQLLVDRGGIAGPEGHEIAAGRDVFELQALQGSDQLRHAATIQLIAGVEEFVVVQRSQCPGQCQVIDVERLAYPVHQVGDLRRGQGVADAQTGQAVDLGERAADNQIREVLQPAGRINPLGCRDVLVVGLVEDDHHVLRNAFEEGAHLGIRQEVAGRVVRVGDPHDAGIRTDGRQHGIEVVAVVPGRRDDQLGPGRQRGQRIHGKGMLGEDGGAPRRQEDAGDQVEHIIRAVAQNDLILGNATPFGHLGDEVELVRVALDPADGFLDGLPGLRAHAQRVLVGGQLDDAIDRNAHLAGQFGDRLAWLVRGNGANVGQGLFGKAHEAFLNKRRPGRTRGFSGKQRKQQACRAPP